MNLLTWPWLEVAIILALIGAVSCTRLRQPLTAWLTGLVFSAFVLGASILASAAFYWTVERNAPTFDYLQNSLFGRSIFGVDALNAPLLPLVGFLHFLTVFATNRTKMRRFSASWSLASEAVRLAILSCQDQSILVVLLIGGVVFAGLELVDQGKPIRVYAVHMVAFSAWILLGWWLVKRGEGDGLAVFGSITMLSAILLRCGTVPFHTWLTDWVEHASFGNALLFILPLTGVYAAWRLVLPVAPTWVLQSLGAFSLITTIYAAAMATIQQDPRRFFTFLFLSHVASVLLGIELHTPTTLTASLLLWWNVTLSLGGLGLTLRALEARVGRLSLDRYHGLYEHCPLLAVCFLVTGLASVGFPGALGFVAADLLIEGAVASNIFIGVGLVLATALNGIAILRAYFSLFTGARHVSNVSLAITWRERLVVWTLITLLAGSGVLAQLLVNSCYHVSPVP